MVVWRSSFLLGATSFVDEHVAHGGEIITREKAAAAEQAPGLPVGEAELGAQPGPLTIYPAGEAVTHVRSLDCVVEFFERARALGQNRSHEFGAVAVE